MPEPNRWFAHRRRHAITRVLVRATALAGMGQAFFFRFPLREYSWATTLRPAAHGLELGHGGVGLRMVDVVAGGGWSRADRTTW